MGPDRQLRRNLTLSLSILGITAVISTIGFVILGYPDRSFLEALHITANIFSTVGNWNTSFSQAEKLWEIIIVTFGVGAALFAFGSVLAVLTSGEVKRIMGRRILTGRLKSLEQHYIVCGFGRMGLDVCRSLARENARFVLIDSDAARTAAADDLGYLYILGDASDETILKMANVTNARGLVTCLGHDAENIFVTLTARGLSPDLLIIARAEEEATEHRLLRAGANRVVCPQTIGAQRVTRMLLHPALIDLMDAATESDVAIDRVSISRLPGMAGKTLLDLALPKAYGLMILAVVRADATKLFNPPANHRLTDEEQLIIIGPRKTAETLEERFGRK